MSELNQADKPAQTEADKIWNEVKDVQLEMFALPKQPLSAFARREVVEPSKLYLVSNVSSLIAALDGAIGSKYNIDLTGKWLTVSRK